MNNMKKRLFIAGFIVPTLVFFIIFTIYPMLQALYISLFNWRGVSKSKQFVGLDNFSRMLSDKIVWESLLHNLFMLFFTSIITFILAMFFAAVFTKKNYSESKFYRVVYLFPNVLSIVIISIIWMFIYNPSFGILNKFLGAIGLEKLALVWLGDEKTVLPALVAPQVWMQVGFFMTLYYAGMKAIPASLYESAKIDGASEFRQFISITVPLMWEIIRNSFVFFVTQSFNQTFALVLVTTKGGPNRASEMLTTYMYEQAFDFSQFGYGTAVGVLIFAVMFIISQGVLRLAKRETYEFS